MSTLKDTPREQAVKLFPDLVIFKEKELIANRFTGEEIELEPEAVAVYDLCMGAEQFGMWKIVRKCLDWFKQYYPKEYLVLLD
tara:strand:- start:45 stop:293 length:249 start_codon:yes stop_codon:yes gene_type:complete